MTVKRLQPQWGSAAKPRSVWSASSLLWISHGFLTQKFRNQLAEWERAVASQPPLTTVRESFPDVQQLARNAAWVLPRSRLGSRQSPGVMLPLQFIFVAIGAFRRISALLGEFEPAPDASIGSWFFRA